MSQRIVVEPSVENLAIPPICLDFQRLGRCSPPNSRLRRGACTGAVACSTKGVDHTSNYPEAKLVTLPHIPGVFVSSRSIRSHSSWNTLTQPSYIASTLLV